MNTDDNNIAENYTLNREALPKTNHTASIGTNSPKKFL